MVPWTRSWIESMMNLKCCWFRQRLITCILCSSHLNLSLTDSQVCVDFLCTGHLSQRSACPLWRADFALTSSTAAIAPFWCPPCDFDVWSWTYFYCSIWWSFYCFQLDQRWLLCQREVILIKSEAHTAPYCFETECLFQLIVPRLELCLLCNGL